MFRIVPQTSNAKRIGDEAWERVKPLVLRLHAEDWTREEVHVRLKEEPEFEELTLGQLNPVMRDRWGLKPKTRKRLRNGKSTETEEPTSPATSSTTPIPQAQDVYDLDQSLSDMSLGTMPTVPLESINESLPTDYQAATRSETRWSLPDPEILESNTTSAGPENIEPDVVLYRRPWSIHTGSSRNSLVSFRMYSERVRTLLRRRKDSDSIRSKSTTDSRGSNAFTAVPRTAPVFGDVRYDSWSGSLNGI